MVSELMLLPDEHLGYVSHEADSTGIRMHVESTTNEAVCPYCGEKSHKVHSRYERELQDLPMQGKKVRLILWNKKYFCTNPSCGHKTFAEQVPFYEPKSQWTNQLNAEILRVSLTQSSVSASRYLRGSVADVGKSVICDILKNEREKHN